MKGLAKTILRYSQKTEDIPYIIMVKARDKKGSNITTTIANLIMEKVVTNTSFKIKKTWE